MHFATLDIYLSEADLSEASALPVAFVARWLNVTPPAVKAMLARGDLSAVGIGSVQFVSAQSLKTWHREMEREVRKTRKVLSKAAKKGKPISYSDLLTKLDRTYTNPADRRRIGRLLRAVSAQSHLEDGELLAIWAYSKATGLPKYGVWEIAEEQGWWAPGKDRAEFVEAMRAQTDTA